MILLLIGVFAIFNIADCAITKWSAGGTDVFTGATGSGNCGSVAENEKISITLAATAKDTPVKYAVTTQPSSNTGTYTFAIDSNGVLTLKTGTLNSASANSLEVAITATDSASTPNTGVLTCTIKITGIAPVFVEANTCTTVADALESGSPVATRTATGATAYAITDASNTNSDFHISNAGLITNVHVLAAATTPKYTLVITATGSGNSPGKGTATLTVCVGPNCCSGAASITISAISLMCLVLVFLMKV